MKINHLDDNDFLNFQLNFDKYAPEQLIPESMKSVLDELGEFGIDVDLSLQKTLTIIENFSQFDNDLICNPMRSPQISSPKEDKLIIGSTEKLFITIPTLQEPEMNSSSESALDTPNIVKVDFNSAPSFNIWRRIRSTLVPSFALAVVIVVVGLAVLSSFHESVKPMVINDDPINVAVIRPLAISNIHETPIETELPDLFLSNIDLTKRITVDIHGRYDAMINSYQTFGESIIIDNEVDEDTDLKGILATYNGIENHIFDGYALQVRTSEPSMDNTELWTITTHATGTFGGAFNYEFEFATQSGDTDYEGDATNAELDYTFDSGMMPPLFADAASFSGLDDFYELRFDRLSFDLANSEFHGDGDMSNVFILRYSVGADETEKNIMRVFVRTFEMEAKSDLAYSHNRAVVEDEDDQIYIFAGISLSF